MTALSCGLTDSIDRMAASRGDFAPFEENGVPFLFFSTGLHDDYHRPSDTLDKLDPDTLRRIATIAWRTTVAVDASDRRPAVKPERPPTR